MAIEWFERARSNGSALHDRLADAADTLLSTVRDANGAIARNAANGLDRARDYSSDLIAGARRYGNSTRNLIAERPVESVVIVALTGIAIGWIWRRMREPARPAAAGARANAPRARKSAPARRKADPTK